MTIRLNDIFNIREPEQFKLHLACRNVDFLQPLDEFVSDPAKWLAWNEYRNTKNEWNRPYLLSFMDFYPAHDSWLFGGAFEVAERHDDRYVLRSLPAYENYVGRLIVAFHRYQGMRGRHYRLENYLDAFEVKQILPERYNGEEFCGCSNIAHDFSVLEPIFRDEKPDWKAALWDVKGVYLIADKSNGKLYVGSAYGDDGIWSRWACYMETGHGWNDAIVQLLKEKGIKYARENFRLSVLEVMIKSTPDDLVLQREGHWKNALLARVHGYNKN